MESNKIKIAFIKYGGLSAGGTEKFLQTIAGNLNKNIFDVTYFYCNSSKHVGSDLIHPDTDPYRISYLNNHGVKTIEFNVGKKDLTSPFHNWVDTNFWDKFNESDFDIIQTGRAGHKEYPFNKIRRIPIVDSIHLTAGIDNQMNISRVMHITNWSAQKWIKAGGDKNRIVIVSHPMEINEEDSLSLRPELKINSSIKVFGFHQRNSDSIFSPLPLQAYKQIESPNNHFVIMGGSQLYRKQATELDIKNISFIDHTAEQKKIYSFLKTLDVYAHGRSDGEVNSTAMAEAMYFGLPIVSHTSKINNGHIECIADSGLVVTESDANAYANELLRLQNDNSYYKMRSDAAKCRFKENYELAGQIRRIENIYKDVIANPFHHPVVRFLSKLHWTQNIRIFIKWIYLKTKFFINGKI